MKWINTLSKALVPLSALLTNVTAYADHAGWSSYRGGYGGSYQFITESEFIQSSTTFLLPPSEEALVQTPQQKTASYKGPGLKTSMSTELVRFVRFSAYHLYRDQSNNLSDSMRGSEVGGEMKLSFWGPVVNLQLGLGLSGSRINHQNKEGATVYFGTGYAGSVGIERFIASNASIVFTIKGQQEELRAEETSKNIQAQSSTVGAGLALVLWLN